MPDSTLYPRAFRDKREWLDRASHFTCCTYFATKLVAITILTSPDSLLEYPVAATQ